MSMNVQRSLCFYRSEHNCVNVLLCRLGLVHTGRQSAALFDSNLFMIQADMNCDKRATTVNLSTCFHGDFQSNLLSSQ